MSKTTTLMTRRPLALAVLLGATALAGTAFAQNPGSVPGTPTPSPGAPPPAAMDGPSSGSRTPSIERSPAIEKAPGARESAAPGVSAGEGANALIGLPVVTTDGQKIGDVAKVATDASGKVREIELKVGGFLGLGGKSVMVPGEKVNASGKKQVVLLMTAEQAKALTQ
jgi:sporulation protein YlmC with PRC-barrel domain